MKTIFMFSFSMYSFTGLYSIEESTTILAFGKKSVITKSPN